MEDREILALYWERKEEAIRETDNAYGPKLQGLAWRIVQSREDAQECVSDTYLRAWNTIPPQRPDFLFAYLAKICRFCAFGVLDWRSAQKRKGNVVALTEEMEQCIPDPKWNEELEDGEISRALNRFLGTLSRESRVIFIRRYWYLDSVDDIARRYGITQSKVKTRLHRTRERLRNYLAEEGISV